MTEKVVAVRYDAATDTDELVVRVDGRLPLTAESVAVLDAVCDRAEENGRGRVLMLVSGTPDAGHSLQGLTVALVSKWERVLRRVERLRSVVVAVADGDCGGLALDAFLAADYRVVTAASRLTLVQRAGATWPGMALYRLSHQRAGVGPVRRAVLFGRPLTTDDLVSLDLVDELVDDLPAALDAVARLADEYPGSELAIRRQLMFEAHTTGFDEALGAHLAACDRELRRFSAGAAVAS